MKIKKLEILNKALLFLVTGTISLTSVGCTKVNRCDNKTEKEISIDNDELASDEISTQEKEKDSVKTIYEYLDNTYGFAKENVYLRSGYDKNSEKIAKIKKYEKVKLISKSDGWDYVKYNGKNGYIKDKKIKKLHKEFIDVDISEQKLRYYDKDGNVIIKSNIVTGTDSVKKRRTNVGCFKIEEKVLGKTLRGSGYESKVDFWMPFNLGEEEGLHDAYRWRSQYGGNIYKNNGSHGCVNLPRKKAEKIFKKCSVGTRVLVHR